jgi:hypothetical protein
MEKLDETTKTKIAKSFIELKDRITNPEGTWDKGGRFYLDNSFECCKYIRTPSRRWPYSEMIHGRTLQHAASEILGETPSEEQLAELRKRVNQIKNAKKLTEKLFEKYVKSENQKRILKNFMETKNVSTIIVENKRDKQIVTIIGEETNVYEFPEKNGIDLMTKEILVTGDFKNIKEQKAA